MLDALGKAGKNACALHGVTPPAFGCLAALTFQNSRYPLSLVVLPHDKEVDRTREDLDFFLNLLSKSSIRVLPLREVAGEIADRRTLGFDHQLDQISTLNLLANQGREDRFIVVASLPALAQALPVKSLLLQAEIRLETGMSCSFTGLVNRLNELGYDQESEVEGPGQFAVRGGIIDLYPVNEHTPFRLDFFGDEIEEIRTFEPHTQRSSSIVESLTVAPPPGDSLPTVAEGILEYLPTRVQWQFWEPRLSEENYPQFYSNRDEDLSLAKLLNARADKGDAWLAYSALDQDSILFDASVKRISVPSEPLEHYRSLSADPDIGRDRFYQEQEDRLKFFGRLQSWQQEGYEVILSVQTQGEMDRLDEFIASELKLGSFSATRVLGNLNKGFRCDFTKLPSAHFPRDTGSRGIVFVTDSEIFARYRKRLAVGRPRKVANRQQVDQILDFSELVEGDYLVHLQNGICIYRGLGQLDARRGFREVISLEFDDGIILHLPLHESHLLTRYVGLKKVRPVLGKVGSNRWERTRRQAEEATLDLAARLLQNQASRDSQEGFAFSADSNWQREFEAAFPYQETPDQLNAITETKQDQEKPHPMDRLICGDVGFGKTEVAIRAAFKVVLDGKQVALLGPTTVLTQQHFNTFRQRMASFPIVVEMLNRFRTKPEQSKIIQALPAGKIDILIGTHRLLSGDVGFKDLGLLIIDEEHRFGVKHKERLKEYRVNVDVLSLSATPIPRTLYMALMGARDLSVIETAPLNRRPIETIIKNYDPQSVCQAISKEVARGGQVFYLHNRVQSIHAVAAQLEEMLPEVRFAVAHGQLHERTLERIMSRFVDGQYDVLVSTTIIESGLDIPNANTIIIEAADRFGLAQLYQIRGRVGRFNRQAYAYLLLHRHARVLDTARRRLAALKQYNQLGAGFRIAMRDLELRGAGNLLGAEQSGHIAGVGFDLYCQLLKQSIARLKGDKSTLRIRATVQLDFVYMGERLRSEESIARDGYQALKREEIKATQGRLLEARIPSGYLEETRLRIEVYRQLAMAEDLESIDKNRPVSGRSFWPLSAHR